MHVQRNLALIGWVGLGLLGVLAPSATSKAAPLQLDAKVDRPLLLAGRGHRAYLKVALTGGAAAGADEQRAPVNVALVIDRSGSMRGRKLEEAKRAAIEAIDRLEARDTVSVVVYDDTVRTLVPATRLTRRSVVRRAIQRIRAGGSTALFGGVSRGAAEVRKFLSPDRVNRVILLSDGIANVGPSSPGELAELGRSLASEGISVTTFGLGLGYNEDLMAQLAMASDGNHAFIEDAQQLAAVFDAEFGDVLSVVGQNVTIDVHCHGAARFRRSLGRPAAVTNRRARARLNQLYAGQEKYVLLEMDVPSLGARARQKIADVSVTFRDMQAHRVQSVRREVFVTGTDSAVRVARGANRDVQIATAELLANEDTKRALELRDVGRTEEARRVLEQSATKLTEQNRSLRSEKLERVQRGARRNAQRLNQRDWTRTRKSMRKTQHELDMQQAY